MTRGTGQRFVPLPSTPRGREGLDPVSSDLGAVDLCHRGSPLEEVRGTGHGTVGVAPPAPLLDARSSLPSRTAGRTRARDALLPDQSPAANWATRGGPRILPTTSPSVIMAISRRGPPQSGPVRTSTAKTRVLRARPNGADASWLGSRARRGSRVSSSTRWRWVPSNRGPTRSARAGRARCGPDPLRDDADASSRFVAQRRTGAFQLRRGREHAVVRQQMCARPGHERGEALEEGQRLEEDRAGAVAPSTPQPVDHAPVETSLIARCLKKATPRSCAPPFATTAPG